MPAPECMKPASLHARTHTHINLENLCSLIASFLFRCSLAVCFAYMLHSFQCCEWLLPSDASTLTSPFTDNRSFLAFPCPPRALLVEPCVSVYPLLLLVVFESPSCLLFDSVCVKRWYSWLVFCFWACFPFCLPCSWHCPAAVFRLLR